MSTTYNANGANVSLASAVSETIPADGDALTAGSANTALQKLADYIEALRLTAAGAFAEGFESATFPPVATSKWATPSTRYGSDSSWVRTTTNPITSTASASAPVPQTLSTNSALGLDTFLASPARLSFLFAVNCNNNNGDHLDFYVDGVLTAQLSTQVSNTLVAGKFVTDLLREGLHTFDWRFVRGGSASVGSEECKIDTVEIIPEEVWRGDPTRALWFDEGFSPDNGTMTASSAIQKYPWSFVTGANPGLWSSGGTTARVLGFLNIQAAATAAGDWATAYAAAFNATKPELASAFFETRCAVPSVNTSQIIEIGWGDLNVFSAGNMIGWAWDGSLGIGSTWRNRGIVAGALTTVDSGYAVANTVFMRLGVITSTVRGVTSAVYTKDGKALPGTGSVPPLMVTGIPSAVNMQPFARARSVTGALAAAIWFDWMRVLMLR